MGSSKFIFILLSLCFLFNCFLSARDNEGNRINSLLLNGLWEFAVGDGSEQGESITGQKALSWQSIELPGPFKDVSKETKIVWVRRTFQLTSKQAKSLAVLRWNRIAYGAEAFVNGKKVGENEPTGPYQVIISDGILKSGDNQIVLKIRGAAGVRLSQSGFPLFPCGFGVDIPRLADDIWIDFAHDAYMKWALAIPNLASNRVTFRVTPVGLKKLDHMEIVATVTPWSNDKNVKPAKTWTSALVPARLIPEPDPLCGEHFYVDVHLDGCEYWSFEEQPLYSAHIQLLKNGKTLDETTFRFGMREIGVKDQNYKLNGKNLWLRGSNLVFEWDWEDIITGKEIDYLVTEAREMSMNSFRTHTQPPNRLWSAICDEHGTMFLAEFPVLYNYRDYKFTTEEYDIWHQNVLTDAAGWMARLWNHPSVIMWVLSNESVYDNLWEETIFQDFVNRLDPTRPTMRTGTTGTKENYDVHACMNISETHEGNMLPLIQGWFTEAGNRTLTNSEYMNFFQHPYTQWAGVNNKVANDIAVAQIGAEHTEAMRRVRLDGILPYMYAPWTRTRLSARLHHNDQGSAVWKANYASPLSAAWHSTLSPIVASLDLFDPNHLTGQNKTTDLYLINDSWHDAQVHVDLLITKENPEWIPEAACFDHPVSQWSFDFSIQADTLLIIPVEWQLPTEEGAYWLTARLTGIKGRPVLSQRFIRTVHEPVAPSSLQKKTFVLLGADDQARDFFRSMHLKTGELTQSETLFPLLPDKHTVVIWNATHVTPEEKKMGRKIREFADRGGQVIVLSTPSWDWQELVDIHISRDPDHPLYSRVYLETSPDNPLSGQINPHWLIRWNGIPGTVAFSRLDGEIMKHAKPLLWAREPETVVMAFVPTPSGRRNILFSQLDIQNHVNKNRDHYDPVVVSLLLRLLGKSAVYLK